MNLPRPAWGSLPTQDNRLLRIHTALEDNVLLVQHADITERLNQLPEITLELLSADPRIDPLALLGRPVQLQLDLSDLTTDGQLAEHDQEGHATRCFSGLCSQFGRLRSDGGWSVYQMRVVPWLNLLAEGTRDTRVWQHMSCLDIARTLFEEAGHHGDLRIFTRRELPRYEFRLQYRESNYAFFCQLMEQEGLAWWIAFERDRQIVCIGDHPSSHPPLQDAERIAFHGDDAPFHSESITQWTSQTNHRVGDIRYRDYDYHRPHDRLDAGMKTLTNHALSTQPERYDYASLYDTGDEGERYSRIAIEREEALHRRHTGESNVRALAAGHRFELTRHFADDGQYLLLEVRHTICNNYLRTDHSADRPYRNEFLAQPWQTQYRPPLLTPRAQVEGLHSAFVVGPEGSEWYGERMGRIKVWMPFDRRQPMDEKASFWVRVAQPSGDADWGHMFYPRVGQEVLLAFHMGDPSLPIAVSGIYNGAKQPRWYNGYLNGIKSKEFHGNRHNALVFDDSRGELRTTLHSDEHHSQLHLGHLVHGPTASDRGAHRGNGFELRTDAWGSLRAARGLFVTTHARLAGKSAVLDHAEANAQLKAALDLSKSLSDTARQHHADALAANQTLAHFRDATDRPDGAGVNTFGEPALLIDGAAGVGVTTPKSAHVTANDNLHLISGRATNLAVGDSLAVSAAKAVSVFAYQEALKLFAARGKVQVQAQDNAIEQTAKRHIDIVSTEDRITLAAQKEIVLTSGGAYIKLDGKGNIEIHAPGKVSIKGQVEVAGPAGMDYTMPQLPKGGYDPEGTFLFSA